MFRSCFLFFLTFFCFGSFADLEPDFFKRQKEISKEKKQRLKGATSYTKMRKQQLQKKDAKAVSYRAIRKKAEKAQKKKDALFESDMIKPEPVNTFKLKQAQKYAKQKRKKKQKTDDWKTQNLEFGIKVKEPNILKKKKNK